MAKIGIIRCNTHSESCAGWHCFPAARGKTGQFAPYDEVEIVGFDTCGGCGRGSADKIKAKAVRLKERGAEVIHIGNCIISRCPSRDLYLTALRGEIGLPVVEKTH